MSRQLDPPAPNHAAENASYSLRQLVLYALRLGAPGFGDMLELGHFARDEHATAEAALKAGMAAQRVHLFAAELSDAVALARARQHAAECVRAAARQGDIVLVKGSLGVGMDEVVKALQERRGGGRIPSDIS